MTIIANPIYDAVFKFLMEDKKVAKIFLSALLKKDIIDLEMRRHEYTSMEHTRISLFLHVIPCGLNFIHSVWLWVSMRTLPHTLQDIHSE